MEIVKIHKKILNHYHWASILISLHYMVILDLILTSKRDMIIELQMTKLSFWLIERDYVDEIEALIVQARPAKWKLNDNDENKLVYI